MSVQLPERRACPAKVHLVAAGESETAFAIFSKFSRAHVYAVLNRRAPASPRFRTEMSRFLGLPESVLFPEDGAS